MNDTIHSGERISPIAVALLCVGLSALAVVPFYWMGQPLPGGSRRDVRMPTTHDMYEHYPQMQDFYRGLAAGEIYPRWEEDTNYGFGAPTTSYYPPGVYYLTSALYALLRDWLRTLLAAHLLMMCASAAAIYWLARRSMSPVAAAVAVAAYIFLPYHLADQYHREAIAELLGFVWMPLMLGFADELLSEPAGCSRAWAAFAAGLRRENTEVRDRTLNNQRSSTRDDEEKADSSGETGRRNDTFGLDLRGMARPTLLSCGLGAAYGAFLWSHPPTAYQFSLAFALAVPVLAFLRRNWRGLPWIAGGIVLGLGFSAAYLYPAAVEAKFIRSEIIVQTWPYQDSYLLQSESSSRYPQFLALLNHSWWLGLLATVSLVLVFVALAPKAPKGVALTNTSEDASGSWWRGRLGTSVAAWTVLSGFATFMMLRQSDFLSRHIPKFDIGVFSWRMLAISTLSVALLTGAAVQAAIDAKRLGKPARSAAFVGVVLTISLGAAWLSIGEAVAPANASPAFQPPDAHVNYLIVPRTAPCPDDLPDLGRVQARDADVSVTEWKPQRRVIEVNAPRPDPLVIRTFNFPGWKATLDGHSVPLGTVASTGAIVVDVPHGQHVLTLDFVDTPVRRFGAAITLASSLLMLTLAAFGIAARSGSVEI